MFLKTAIPKLSNWQKKHQTTERAREEWAREGEKKYTHFEAKLIVSMAEIVVKPNKRSSTVERKRESIEIYAC